MYSYIVIPIHFIITYISSIFIFRTYRVLLFLETSINRKCPNVYFLFIIVLQVPISSKRDYPRGWFRPYSIVFKLLNAINWMNNELLLFLLLRIRNTRHTHTAECRVWIYLNLT